MANNSRTSKTYCTYFYIVFLWKTWHFYKYIANHICIQCTELAIQNRCIFRNRFQFWSPFFDGPKNVSGIWLLSELCDFVIMMRYGNWHCTNCIVFHIAWHCVLQYGKMILISWFTVWLRVLCTIQLLFCYNKPLNSTFITHLRIISSCLLVSISCIQ